MRFVFSSLLVLCFLGIALAQKSPLPEVFDELAKTYLEEPIVISPSQDPDILASFVSSGKQADRSEHPCTFAKDTSGSEGYTVNFEEVPVMALIRFISQISNTNFVFDKQDLAFNITFVSEEPTSAQDLNAALLQILRMHNLSVLEQGNNVLIYKENGSLSKVATVVTDYNIQKMCDAAVVTRVFRLHNLSPAGVQSVVRPLLSKEAIVEISPESKHLIVSDITPNVERIGDLINALDIPDVMIEVGQYDVRHGDMTALVSYAEKILAPLSAGSPFQLIPQKSSQVIFIVSTPFLISKAQEILANLDTKGLATDLQKIDLPSDAMVNNNFFVYKLLYHKGQEIAQSLRDIGANLERAGLANMDLVNAINSLQWIEANNSLVFSGTDTAITKIKELLIELDVAPKQVYIEVLIIDTTIKNSLDFGVQWVALGEEQNKLAYASGFLQDAPSTAPIAGLTGLPQVPLYGGARDAATTPPPTPIRGGAPGSGGDIPLGSGFGLGIVGNILRHNGQSFLTLGALVSALEADANTTIVLNPRIMSEDNKEANFFVGQNIPYQSSNTIIRDTGSVTQNLQYEDVGVQLRVTPSVGANHMVTLQIDQSVSDIQSLTQQISTVGGTTLLLAPTTNKTLTTTRVHVPDGAFLVMSGHIREQETVSRSGIPCLGTLPLVGPAFSTTSENREKRNMIMFIRPHVISNPQEGTQLSNQEGYDYNWESNPSSIRVCGPDRAPEAQTYPPSPCPDR